MNPYSPYSIKTESIQVRLGCWNVTECSIWRQVGLEITNIGRYQYNYHSGASDIFYPFQQGDQWYALYATDYETISLMTLPDCKEVELTKESKENLRRFCPVESWVPAYQWYPYDLGGGKSSFIYLSEEEISDSPDTVAEHGPIYYHSFAFVAGCVWGDDSSLKVNMLDLSKIKDGILKFVGFRGGSPWSYLELPRNLPLNKAIHIEVWDDPNKPRFWWATPRIIDYKDGSLVDFESK